MNQELNRSVRTMLPLQNGDRLTRAEFERRYEAMPHLKKAELIKGVVYMSSPVSHGFHSRPHAHVLAWLGQYVAFTPGIDVGDNGTVRLSDDSEPQPDAFLMLLPAYGGQAKIDDDDYISGTPELVVEIAASSASYDLHDKLEAYRDFGVKEYLVWRTYDTELNWFVLREGKFVDIPPDGQGIVQSSVFRGLWLDAGALLQGDLARVLGVAQQGIASPEHAAFVEELRRRSATT